MKVLHRNQIIILEIIVFCLPLIFGADCGCSCKWFARRGQNDILCNYLEDLNLEVEANKEALLNWNKYINFVQRFSEYWRQDIANIVEEQLQNGVGCPIGGQRSGKRLEPLTEKGKCLDLEERLFRMENRVQDLENQLTEEQEIRKQLERDVAGTRATLIDLLKQIMNLTSAAKVACNMLPTIPNSPHFPNGFHEYLEDIMKHLQIDVQQLHEVRSVKDFRVFNSTLRENPGMFEHEREIFDADALRMKSLEANVKVLDSTVGEIMTKIQCIDCKTWERWVNWENRKRKHGWGKWSKEKEQKKSKSESYVTKPTWDDYY